MKIGSHKLFALGAGAVVAAAAAGYALYGNSGSDVHASCTISEQLKPQLASFAANDVAALQTAKAPADLNALAFTDTNGASKTLADWNGKTILVNLWATWCAPCRAEMPTFDALQAERGSDKFEVIAVNVDSGDDGKARAFLSEIGIKNLAFYQDSSLDIFKALQQKGLSRGLPATLLIGHDGCSLGEMQGPAEWSSPAAIALIDRALEG
jgi:thiol-disulfide isomerase/thioredoxin